MIFLTEEEKISSGLNDLRIYATQVALSQIEWKKDDEIISLCCGTAPYEFYILENYKIKSLIGFDTAEDYIAEAKKYQKEHNIKNAKFILRNVDEINLKFYPSVNKLMCFGFSHNPLNLLFLLFQKKDLFDFLQRGGKFYIYPAEGGYINGQSVTGKGTLYCFERTQVESVSLYMSYLSNIFATRVYNNNIIEIGGCILDKEMLKDLLVNIRSDYSCISVRNFSDI